MTRTPNFDSEDAARRLLAGEDYRLQSEWDLVSQTTWSSETDDEQLLAALTLIDALRREADGYERQLLKRLREQRDDPVSWPRIATALRVTRQGAERRYLRATASGVRDANRARSDMHVRRERQERNDTAARARWGRTGQADRAWHLQVRARTARGEEVTARLSGVAGVPPELRGLADVGNNFDLVDRLEILEVLEEVTPWEDLEPSTTLAGLTGKE